MNKRDVQEGCTGYVHIADADDENMNVCDIWEYEWMNEYNVYISLFQMMREMITPGQPCGLKVRLVREFKNSHS